MNVKLLRQFEGQRTFAVVFDKDEEFISGLRQFAADYHLAGSHFTGIGAFSEVTLRFFDRRKMEYKDIPVREQVEVLSIIGNITRGGEPVREGLQPKLHVHAVVGRADGTTRGGHVHRAIVWPTLEVIVVEEVHYLKRTIDEETGLALIDITQPAPPESEKSPELMGTGHS